MNEVCPTCNGSGGIDVLEYSMGEIVTIPCPNCGGTGYDEKNGIEDSRIEQVKRVQELEQQNERYREALTFYAEESNYDYDVRVDSISYVGDQSEMKFYRLDSEILYDRGKKARQALEGEE